MMTREQMQKVIDAHKQEMQNDGMEKDAETIYQERQEEIKEQKRLELEYMQKHPVQKETPKSKKGK